MCGLLPAHPERTAASGTFGAFNVGLLGQYFDSETGGWYALKAAGIDASSMRPKSLANQLISIDGVSGSLILMGNYTADVPGF